jgi:hypothetical protein
MEEEKKVPFNRSEHMRKIAGEHNRRPKGAILKKRDKAKILERALKKNTDVNEIIKALYRLAMGVTVEKVKDGVVTVYTEKPDREAASILIDHGFGKPTQKVQEEVTHTFKNLTPQEMQKLPSDVLNAIVNGKRIPVTKN